MRTKWRLVALSAVSVSILGLAACSNSSSSSGPASNASSAPATLGATGTKVAGGTATFAESPGAPPTYIFPMEPAIQETEANIDVTLLLYRPLYWYGNDENPSIDYNYSIANPPVWSNDGKTVTITLKNWKWSNGETVTSRDVEFWMNLLKATIPEGSWGFYAPGYFPDMIAKAAYPNASTIVFTLNHQYNEKWFLYSELSQITPIPMAWDRTSLSQPAPNPSAANLPDTTASGARAVYALLNSQSANITSWGSSPIWSVVDGPWRVVSATSTGEVVFKPNPDYSGSPKPSLSTFIEEPFTSNQAEFNLVQSQGPSGLQFGFLPPEYAPKTAAEQQAGYRVLPEYNFSYSFILINFHNPTLGPVFQQLYIREALQRIVDQAGWIHAFLHDDAVPTYGPIPLLPKNSYIDSYEQQDRYSFDIDAAKALLQSHGWTEKNGVDVCTRPGSSSADCGTGIKSGQSLSLSLGFASGMASLAEEMQNFQSDAARIGITVSLNEHPLNVIFGESVPCTASQKACSWQALDYGSGVQYAVGYYPSGEQLLATGAGFNLDNYSNPTMDSLITASTNSPVSDSQSSLDAYENFAAKDLPYIYTPTSAGNPYANSDTLIGNHLGGVNFNVFTLITPETWYLTK
jgi:peptide/nickel transport system substrate-binding protein